MSRNPPDISGVWKLRAVERRLFAWMLAAIATGYVTVWLALRGSDARFAAADAAPLAVFVAALLVTHLGLVLFRCRGDAALLSSAMFLAGLGLLAQVRMGRYDLDEPYGPAVLAFPIGILAMILLAGLLQDNRIDLLEALWPLCWLAAVAVVGATLVFGRRYRGAVFLPGNVNPTEIVKVLLALFLAGFITSRREAFRTFAPANWGYFGILAFLWLVPMAMFALQRDLGMLVLLNAILIVTLFVSTGRWAYVSVGLLAAGGLGAAIFRLVAHARQRLDVWQNPFMDPTGSGWQVLQGLSAMYTGGIWGRGLGGGSPDEVPIASSDFIYAVLGEELGYVGCLFVLGAYGILAYRGFAATARLQNPFQRALAAALTFQLTFQAVLNVGGVTKAIPMTGITLPFISHGGSSLLTSFVALGLLMALSEQDPPAKRDRKKGRRAKPKPARTPEWETG